MPTLQTRVKETLAHFDEMTPDEVRRVLADVVAHFDAHDPIAQAMSTLSYSEEQALAAVAQEMEPTGGLLVSSKIADRVGITRSVIVNGLRKLESAGVIEARSLGMKGTHVTVLVPGLVERLRQLAA